MKRSQTGSSSWQRAAGFTLVELIVVLFIMAVLAAVAMGLFSRAVAPQQLEAAAKRIAADIAFVRQQAIATGENRSITFTPSTDRYEAPDVIDPDHGTTPYTIDMTRPPYQIDVLSADFDSSDTLEFDAYGRPVSGGTVVIASGDRQKQVLVDGDTGRASIQDE